MDVLYRLGCWIGGLSGVYLSVFLVTSFGGDVLGSGSIYFFIGCGIIVLLIWLGDDVVGSLTLFCLGN